MIFNVHTHLNEEKDENLVKQLINECLENKVTNLLIIGYDVESSKRAVEIANEYDFIYASVAVSPFDVEKDNSLEELEKLIQENKKVVAVGEIGLDYHYEDNPSKEIQKQYFIKEIKLAGKYNLPIIIHSRDAMKDTIDILKEQKKYYERGIMHCYNGSKESSDILANLGFYFSFAGPLTYKNSKNLKEVASYLPMDKILIETDDPYLPPALFRGQRNHPSYVTYVAKELSLLKNISYEEVCKITKENAQKVLGL